MSSAMDPQMMKRLSRGRSRPSLACGATPRILPLLLVGVLVVAGCSSPSVSLARRVATSGCEARAGETGRSLTVRVPVAAAESEGQERRQYVIHVPLGYRWGGSDAARSFLHWLG